MEVVDEHDDQEVGGDAGGYLNTGGEDHEKKVEDGVTFLQHGGLEEEVVEEEEEVTESETEDEAGEVQAEQEGAHPSWRIREKLILDERAAT